MKDLAENAEDAGEFDPQQTWRALYKLMDLIARSRVEAEGIRE